MAENKLYLNESEGKNSFWKTKNILLLLQNFEITDRQQTLFIVSNPTKCSSFIRGARNIKNLMVIPATSLNLVVLLKAEKLILTTESVEIINSLYGNLYV